MKKYKTKWDLTPLLKTGTDEEIEKDNEKVREESYRFINKWKKRKDYLSKPTVLKEALDEYEAWARNFGTSGNAGYYLSLKYSLDQNNPDIKAKLNKLEDFSVQISNDIQFFLHKVAKIPKNKQKKFLESGDLAEYKHLLECLFEAARYLLSEKEEKILNLKSSTSYSNWVNMTSSFISKEKRKVLNDKGKPEAKSFSEILTLLDNKNKSVRDKAAKTVNSIFRKHLDVAENELNSVLTNKKVNDKLRKYPRPDFASHLADDIETEIVDTLVKSVSNRFDISKRYYELKSKLMDVKKLEYHERNVEYGKVDKKYTFEDAVDLVYKTFEKLDKEFADLFENLLEKGCVDVFPREGKTQGAFCTQDLITQPIYILLNHTNQLRDVLAIAHETGHALNSEFIRRKQNALNFEPPLSVAEFASTFMEDLVLEEILKEADAELRLSIMMSKLNEGVSAIQRQIGCYIFEQNLHKEFRAKGYLSKEDIGKIFTKYMSAYMGEYVEQSPGSQNWWVYWGHIRNFFYVYSYASGLLISKSLQNMVKENPKFIGNVKKFLAVGPSKSPKNAFLDLGIDISDKKFWDKGLDEEEKLLDDTWKLAKKLGKI